MKPVMIGRWSKEVTKLVRRSRSIRRAESRLGARRPNLAKRGDVFVLVRAIEASRADEVVQ